MSKCVVLISGTGSNLKAMVNAGLKDKISAVISNNPNAIGIDIARQHGIPIVVVNHKDYKTRDEFEDELINQLNQYNPQYIILAGFMRILSVKFVNKYPNQIINIHPSLLPSFTGVSAQKQAYDTRVKLSGLTIHFVTSNLDNGPIIAQGVVGVYLNDSYEQLTARILELEHLLYPFIIKKLIDGKVSIKDDGYVEVIHEIEDKQTLSDNFKYIYY